MNTHARRIALLAALAAPACSDNQAPEELSPPADAGSDSEVAPAEDAAFVPTGDGLLIVTTRRIRDGSARLDTFVHEKERRNFRVLVATEDDYGAEDKEGQDRALAIRAWLRAVHKDYKYLLLIGDGHPLYGDVPMMTVWPWHAMAPDSCGGAFAVDCRSCETDMMYSDLDGDWDLNGDGQHGQHGLDDGDGGIDFEPELHVGRMPVYFGDPAEADAMLDRAILYMQEPASAIAWRSRILLAGSFFYFVGQRLQSYTVYENSDGADITEWLARKLETTRPEIGITRLYEREGVAVSAHACDHPVSEDSLVQQWNEGHGMLMWAGHGLPTRVARTVWVSDDDSDGAADDSEIQSPILVRSQTTEKLIGERPAFVWALSCEVGSADIPYNLSQATLLHGGAIGLVGSSKVTPGDPTDYNHELSFDTSEFGGSNGGIAFFEILLTGRTGAEALADAKLQLGSSESSSTYAARMMLNYFGDPTLALANSGEDVVAP
jgi:hypothetical protein